MEEEKSFEQTVTKMRIEIAMLKTEQEAMMDDLKRARIAHKIEKRNYKINKLLE